MNISIHDDYVCKSTNMTLNKLMKHLTDKRDPTHKAIYIYIEKLKTFQLGTARQHPVKKWIHDLLLILTDW
jgi:hypothetical protein